MRFKKTKELLVKIFLFLSFALILTKSVYGILVVYLLKNYNFSIETDYSLLAYYNTFRLSLVSSVLVLVIISYLILNKKFEYPERKKLNIIGICIIATNVIFSIFSIIGGVKTIYLMDGALEFFLTSKYVFIIDLNIKVLSILFLMALILFTLRDLKFYKKAVSILLMLPYLVMVIIYSIGFFINPFSYYCLDKYPETIAKESTSIVFSLSLLTFYYWFSKKKKKGDN